MKSRTSFSKLAIFKKDITRFAPIWALYLIGMMLVLFELCSYSSYHRLAQSIPDLITGFSIVNLIYAALCAVMLFGDLYNTRMCYSLHTIPMRREGLLLSHLAAGFTFSLVPNMLACLFLMVQLESYWYLGLYWLLAVTLQFVFYFGVAAVSALLTGNRFAMLLVYAGLNFVSMLVYWIVTSIYLPQMTGVVMDIEAFTALCPTVHLFNWEYMEFEAVRIPNDGNIYDYATYWEYRGLTDGWGYLAILGGVGVALMVVAVVLYRLRHLESSGDFVAFSKLKNLACVIITVCVAGVFACFGAEVIGDSMVLWLIVGLVIGYFGSLMLLERRVKVFRGKTFLGLGLLAVVLFGSFMLVTWDVFGVVRWTPEPEQVQSVTVANYISSGYYYEDYYYGNRISLTLTEQEDIERIIDAHEDVLARLDEKTDSKHRVVLRYKLKDGRTVVRSYWAPASGTNYQIISTYFYTPQQIIGYTDWEKFLQNIDYLVVDGISIPEDLHEMVMDALRKDCENDHVRLSNGGSYELWVEFAVEQGNGITNYRSLAVDSGAENLLELMKTPEFILGFTDWDRLINGTTYMNAGGWEIEQTKYAGLFEALLEDCKQGYVSTSPQTSSYVYVEYTDWKNNYRTVYVSPEAQNTIAWLENAKEFPVEG